MQRTIVVELQVTADEFDRMTRQPTRLQIMRGAFSRFVEKCFPWRNRAVDFDRLTGEQ